MAEPLPLDIPPGIVKDGTLYARRGRWTDGSLMRFVNGLPQTIGPWEQAFTTGATLISGQAGLRHMRTWVVAPWIASPIIAMGADDGYYYRMGTTLVKAMNAGPSAGIIWSAAPFGDWNVFTNPQTQAHVTKISFSGGVPTQTTTAVALEPGATPAIGMFQIMGGGKERNIIALGGTSFDGLSYDYMLVRWSSLETIHIWAPSASNTAGGKRLANGSMIMQGLLVGDVYYIFTDTALHSMTFIGAPYIYSINELNETSIVSRRGAVGRAQKLYWMRRRGFGVYDGRARDLDCPMSDFLASDMDPAHAWKTFACNNDLFGELQWFYQSRSSTGDIDSYVSYMPEGDIWSYGKLNRTAWVDRGTLDYPIAADSQGRVFLHELSGRAATAGEIEAGLFPAFIESAPLDVDDGRRSMFVRSIWPDFEFAPALNNPTNITPPRMKVTATVGNLPASTPHKFVQQFVSPTRTKIDVGLRGREMSLKYEFDQLGPTAKIGRVRVLASADGGR